MSCSAFSLLLLPCLRASCPEPSFKTDEEGITFFFLFSLGCCQTVVMEGLINSCLLNMSNTKF